MSGTQWALHRYLLAESLLHGHLAQSLARKGDLHEAKQSPHQPHWLICRQKAVLRLRTSSTALLMLAASFFMLLLLTLRPMHGSPRDFVKTQILALAGLEPEAVFLTNAPGLLLLLVGRPHSKQQRTSPGLISATKDALHLLCF